MQRSSEEIKARCVCILEDKSIIALVEGFTRVLWTCSWDGA